MKVIEYKNNLSDSFLKTILPEGIWNLNPIVAGGSAVSLWFLSEMVKNLPSGMSDVFINNFSKKSKIIPYSDIDIWFLNDQVKVISDLISDSPLDRITFGQNSFSLLKKSYWANTYHNSSAPIQFIKKPQNSVEELISSFDISLSSVAFYNGKFILLDNTIKSFESKEIILNNPDQNPKRTFGSKIFQGLRHFKYAKRFDMDFDQNLHQRMIHLFADSVAFLKAFEENDSNHNSSVKITSSNSSYEETITTKESLVGMTKQFCNHFEQLKSMKHFSKTDLLFIPDSKYIPIGRYIESFKVEKVNKTSSLDNAFDLIF